MMKNITPKTISKQVIVNKGTGAGGANTTKTGGSFENKTSNEARLLANGFVKKIFNKNKYGYCLFKK